MTFATAVEQCKSIMDVMDTVNSERADALRVVLECACDHILEYYYIPQCLSDLPEEYVKNTWNLDRFLELLHNYKKGE